MAIDAKTGDMAWRIPLGEYKELTAKGVPLTGTPNVGGPVVTASGVLFIGATSDRMFRAYEANTGKLLWSTELSNNATNSPMTYMGKNGKQYVSVAVSSGLDNFNKPAVDPGTSTIVTFVLP